jgi:hypothetical protein
MLLHPKYDFSSNYAACFFVTLITKVNRLIGMVIGFMTLSFINGLAIRIAILASNVIIFPLMWVIKVVIGQEMTYGQRAQIYHSMGIIGAQSAYLERNGQNKRAFLAALVFTLFIICFMQTSCYYLWTQMMFPYTFPGAINDIYFGYINLVEFVSFIFIRTRMSIKYYPKFITLLNLMFLFYINSYMYAASNQFFAFLFCATLFFTFYFLEAFEYPAMMDWSPFGTYTPRMQSPRIGYQLVLNDTNFGTGFNIWQAFMPLHSRGSFTQEEQHQFDHLSEFQRYFVDYTVQPRVGARPMLSPRARRRIRENAREVNVNAADVMPVMQDDAAIGPNFQELDILNPNQHHRPQGDVEVPVMPADDDLEEPEDDLGEDDVEVLDTSHDLSTQATGDQMRLLDSSRSVSSNDIENNNSRRPSDIEMTEL